MEERSDVAIPTYHRNHWGHSSFVFPHLRSVKIKECPPYNNYFLKKEGLFKTYVVYNKYR